MTLSASVLLPHDKTAAVTVLSLVGAVIDDGGGGGSSGAVVIDGAVVAVDVVFTALNAAVPSVAIVSTPSSIAMSVA